MSQQPKSGGVQSNVNPSLKPKHDNVSRTTDSSDSVDDELWTGERLKYYLPLHNAAKIGDWERAKSFIDRDPNALTAQITVDSQTALHVAACCCQWGFILKLLELLSSPESIEVRDEEGSTVLHYVAQGGSLKTSKALVKKNAVLPQIVDNDGDPPLLNSISSAESKELVWYLSLITRVDSPTFPFFIPSLPGILYNLIQSGYYDVALYFVRRYPNLAIAKDEDGDSLLCWLAINPSYFYSGSNLGFLEKCIYEFVQVEIKNLPTQLVMVNAEESREGFPALQPRSLATQVLQWFKRFLWKAVEQLAPSVKIVREAKLKHECGIELVNHVCAQLSCMSFKQMKHFLQNPNPILDNAVENGIEEIVRTIIQHFPNLINYNITNERNILQAAIEYRQEKIVNIIKEISPTTTKNLCSQDIESKNTTLHLAGKLAPALKLFSVSGAALQMQRELQWFKEVEIYTHPAERGWINLNNETAKDVFRKEHKELAAQGEKWMKDTANSCMLVSTLIATVLFAAAFTVPGGNVNDNGIPSFLRTNAFALFAISDALGLFSSLTSLLMFLAILTARYAVDDFLESLPKKLIIGLGSLFVAIAAMIIAFGATLTIVLSERWHWISMPITLVASFPVAIFVMLQLPLFIQIVQSTYGASIFHPWPSRV